jgi:DNA-directed RNA polymerase specialized sigma24 family protein
MEPYLEFINNEFSDKVIKQLSHKITEDYNDSYDIIQDAMLTVLNKPKELLRDLYERDKLKTFILSTIYMTSKPAYSKFQYNRIKERKIFVSIEDENSRVVLKAQEPEQQDPTEKEVIEAAKQLSEYDLSVLELYATLGTFRAVEKQTGISYINVYNTVKYCRQFIKNKLKENELKGKIPVNI